MRELLLLYYCLNTPSCTHTHMHTHTHAHTHTHTHMHTADVSEGRRKREFPHMKFFHLQRVQQIAQQLLTVLLLVATEPGRPGYQDNDNKQSH